MMGYDTGEIYYSLTFDIDEIRDICNRAKRRGEECVDLKFEYTVSEIAELFNSLPDRDRAELAWEVMDGIGWDEDLAEGFREAGFEAYYAKMTVPQKRDHLDSALSDLPEGENGFVEDWLRENFRAGSSFDELQLRHLLEDAGFGHLLKG